MAIRTTSAPGEAGSLLLRHGFVRDSLSLIRRGLRHNPTDPALLSNLSVAHRLIGDPDRAEHYARRAVEEDPNCGPAWNNWGMISEDLGEWWEALNPYAMAHKLMPDDKRVMVNCAYALMRLQRFEQAWPLWDAGRVGMAGVPPAEGFPVWDGSQNIADKTILVIREGGFGDGFLFARWFPRLAELGARVVFAAWPESLSVFQGVPGAAEVLDLESVELEGLHYCIGLMGLPSALGMRSIADIPPPTALAIDAGLVSAWGQRIADAGGGANRTAKVRIGLCWKAEELATARPHRGIPEREIEGLSRTAKVRWFSLCPRFGKGPACPPWITDLTDGITDWRDTAALILNLDGVVTVDTAVAHLAGSLGIPTWILLPRRSDWKWFANGKRSPWYPGNAHLLRRGNARNWRPLVAHVLAEVQRFEPIP